jgi:hypothetical protein
MAKTTKNDRKAAEVVKCPYCDHTGSARGLFSHVRLAHQGKNVNTRKEWLKNPYAIGKQPKLAAAEAQMELIKNKKKYSSNSEIIGDILLTAFINVANDIAKQYAVKGRIGYIDKPNP